MWNRFCRLHKPGLGALRRPYGTSYRHHCTINQLHASDLASASDLSHVASVHKHLKNDGVLKVELGFEDNESRYLQQLIQNLHQHHGHGLPITHSASRGWFWDVRPLPEQPNSTTSAKPARSETAQDFPWHTDCSYEHNPPRFFALQVLQPDRCGGGTLSILNVSSLARLLSPSTRKALSMPEYRITVPAEFIKSDERHITAGLLGEEPGSGGGGGALEFRFREEILTPLTDDARNALQELGRVLQSAEATEATMHLTPEVLPRGSIVLINNRRWLHARNAVKDLHRHLRRVRWDAQPFGVGDSLSSAAV